MAETLYTQEDLSSMTTEDINKLTAEREKKEKTRRKFRIGLGIIGGALLTLGIITVLPWGMAAFGPAWWAVNGSLMGLGILGLGACAGSWVLGRKNAKQLKILQAEQQLRQGDQDLRTQEKTQQKYVKSYNKGEKYLPEDVKSILHKSRPEIKERQNNDVNENEPTR